MPTDKEVGASSGSAGKKRELVKFAPANSENNSRQFQAFDEEEEKQFVLGSFDQYAERGIESGFKEEYYTTRLDQSQISKEKLREANRIEQVMPTPPSNKHDTGHFEKQSEEQAHGAGARASRARGRGKRGGEFLKRDSRVSPAPLTHAAGVATRCGTGRSRQNSR